VTSYDYSPEIEINSEDKSILEGLDRRKRIRDLQFFSGKCKFKATQFCGSIALSRETIEIIPTIKDGASFYKSLYFMLNRIYSADIRPPRLEMTTEAYLTELNKLADVIALLLCQRIALLEREGLFNEYVEHQRTEHYLIGKLLLNDQLADSSLQPRFHCQYDELTVNNLHNQMLAFSLRQLLSISLNLEIQKKVTRALSLFSEIEPSWLDESAFENLFYSRLNQHYEPMHNLCKLVLRNLSVESIRGNRKATSFLIDVNKVFEAFLASILRDALAHEGYSVYYQFPSYLLKPINHKHQLPLKADIVIRSLRSNKMAMVIDAKFKEVFVTDAYARRALRNSDFFQIYGYASKLKCYGLLVYPGKSELIEDRIDLEWRAEDSEAPSFGLVLVDLTQSAETMGSNLISFVRAKLNQ